MADALNILVMGYGKMGSVHTETALAIRKAGMPLEVSVVEQKTNLRDAAHTRIAGGGGRAYESLSEALDASDKKRKPIDIVVMALNDDQHFSALTMLQRRSSGLKALFSEKPLTETVEQSQTLEPWLRPKFVSLNTVINFSPVFRELETLSQSGGILYGTTPIGFEAAWGKDRTKDLRPTIGIKSDIIHPLGVITEMLGQGSVTLLSGEARRGLLSPGVTDVIYALPETEWQTGRKLPVHLRADYASPIQERSVMAWYRRGGDYLAAHMEFDVKRDGKTVDILRVAEIPMASGEPRQIHLYVGRDADIDHGVAMGDSQGKAQAFLGRSLQAFQAPLPVQPKDLSTLAASLGLQRSIDAVAVGHPKLTVVSQPASERLAQLHGPDLPLGETQRSIGIFPTNCSFETLSRRIFRLEQFHSQLDVKLAQIVRRPAGGNAYLTH